MKKGARLEPRQLFLGELWQTKEDLLSSQLTFISCPFISVKRWKLSPFYEFLTTARFFFFFFFFSSVSFSFFLFPKYHSSHDSSQSLTSPKLIP